MNYRLSWVVGDLQDLDTFWTWPRDRRRSQILLGSVGKGSSAQTFPESTMYLLELYLEN